MPIVEIHMLQGRDLKAKQELVQRVTDAVCVSLGVQREQVRIIIREMKDEDYAAGGVLWSERT
ncbi:4-oxalocrotonate tautomerase family enzyme [Thermanaerovibrio velox DSM 12556]|uniref:Tautomerase n=1 Tax=Thermanaerovibrio velox DSM 12556 TaxID=926567 RepID=H0UQ92_9BACT|nr:2-hydroxymuconate tautomerase [Thermanaerovibrio velox]EHM10730.1 4-oxalocrotonate tautomerase family enzyme [Thermanaerovibrio velox DSM 12556]